MSDKKATETQTEPQVQTFTLTMNINEVNLVISALQELPHRVADPVLKKVIEQAQSQA